ncbi:hypothetical protein [Pedobacter paludis]|uniref:Clp R domain-containing protein n=1 Tax=Pedobacter paludis TaxID=2203212 RepID=A0A317F008_9SPHI|nr:hypothetical protein [Pedobacter paludis]PWS32062.1 hypothetical protein DF947_09795 [Pedobacter paludis]
MSLSKKTRNLIADCRKVAERYNNDYISLSHFFLVYNRYRKNEADFKVSISQQKEFISSIISKIPVDTSKNFPLTVDFERALLYCHFHAWITSQKLVEPHHLLMAIFGDNADCKEKYLEYLTNNDFQLNKLKSLILDIFFNKFARSIGLIRIFKRRF